MVKKIFFIFMTTIIIPLHAMQDGIIKDFDIAEAMSYSVEELEKSIEGMKVTLANPQDPNDTMVVFLCEIKDLLPKTTPEKLTPMEGDSNMQMECDDPAHSAKRTLATMRSLQHHKKLKQ